MKVLHIIPSIGLLRGGPSQVALDICESLAATGLDVTIATTNDNGPGLLDVILGQPVEQNGYKILYFQRTTQAYTSSLSLALWLSQHIHEYDFVHAHAVFSYAPLIAAWLAYRRDVPYAITPHGILLPWGMRSRRTWMKKLSYNLLEKRVLNKASFVHVTSNQEARELCNLGVQAPIEVIYLGIETPAVDHLSKGKLINQYPGLQDRTILLFMGRFHPIKGLGLLLSAFAKVQAQEPDVVLVLAGDGQTKYKTWMQTEIARLGISEHVIWLGFLEGEAKWHALADCDALILPSYSESFGMVVAEAMACGAPVIISDQVAIHDEITKTGAGLVVPCEVEPLVDAILMLVRNVNMRQKMGRQGQLLVQSRFSHETVTVSLMDNYSKSMHSGN